MDCVPYNELTLCGTLADTPCFSHESHGINFYTFPLCIKRLSGTEDIINVISSEPLLPCELHPGDFLCLNGELRSFNNNSGTGNKLAIYAFAKTLRQTDAEFRNELKLGGIVCKPPIYRRTPLGREICDLMIAINRRYGRSDYLPCITWGRLSGAASVLTPGDFIHITGRIQSRSYVKAFETHEEMRIAYEVSVFTLEK